MTCLEDEALARKISEADKTTLVASMLNAVLLAREWEKEADAWERKNNPKDDPESYAIGAVHAKLKHRAAVQLRARLSVLLK